jgi:hypothetical protein
MLECSGLANVQCDWRVIMQARQRRLRFWVEIGLGSLSTFLLGLTLVTPDWIERLFALEPDGGDGSAEWGWALALSAATLILFIDAGRVWWRAAHPAGTR